MLCIHDIFCRLQVLLLVRFLTVLFSRVQDLLHLYPFIAWSQIPLFLHPCSKKIWILRFLKTALFCQWEWQTLRSTFDKKQPFFSLKARATCPPHSYFRLLTSFCHLVR